MKTAQQIKDAIKSLGEDNVILETEYKAWRGMAESPCRKECADMARSQAKNRKARTDQNLAVIRAMKWVLQNN